MRSGSKLNPCPYKAGDGLYGYHILSTHTSHFSHVLICHDPDGRRVVLKTPVDPSDYDYFKREVKWWRTLSAEPDDARHLVRCIDFLRLEHRPFAVLEYVNGPNLRSLLKREERGRLTISQTLHFALQFCMGMVSASLQTVNHTRKARGFAHRDICPENIMIGWEGGETHGRNDLKICDFGLARPLTKDHAKRRYHGFAGRRNYAAPERFEIGSRGNVASDIYSFGVTLWEMLSGFVPFEAGSGESLDEFRWRLLREPVPSLREMRDEAPAHLHRVLEGCLQRIPESRYPSFRILMEELEPLCEQTIGTGLIPGEDRRCRSCGYIPPQDSSDELCALCRAEVELVTMAAPGD